MGEMLGINFWIWLGVRPWFSSQYCSELGVGVILSRKWFLPLIHLLSETQQLHQPMGNTVPPSTPDLTILFISLCAHSTVSISIAGNSTYISMDPVPYLWPTPEDRAGRWNSPWVWNIRLDTRLSTAGVDICFWGLLILFLFPVNEWNFRESREKLLYPLIDS